MSIQSGGRKGQRREWTKIIRAFKNERQEFQVSKYFLARQASFKTSEMMHSSAVSENSSERPASACLYDTHETSLQLLASISMWGIQGLSLSQQLEVIF